MQLSEERHFSLIAFEEVVPNTFHQTRMQDIEL